MSFASRARILEFFDACNSRDLDCVVSFFSSDATYLGSIGPDDDGTTFTGRDEVRRGMDAFLNGHSSLEYTEIDIVLSGDRGFASWTFTGVWPSGQKYSYRGVDLLSFDSEGLVTRKDAFRKERAEPIGGGSR